MKHTIDIPDGYEVLSESIILSQRDETDGYGQDMIVVHLKQKQQKTFDWYVDQYLDVSAGSTNYEIRNWLDNDDLESMSERLKTKQYNLVPWEVKIGLLKFIAKDIHLPTIEAIKYSTKFMIEGYPHMEKLRRLRLICPNEFLHDIQQ